ncbi:MAG: glycosyltransferase family 39 protein [Desulfamplus sp.]|nr:glycosyltransferase family 39 protein [Desulfamplus sp.]
MNIEKLSNWILKAALTVTLIFTTILASVPPICRDSLTHHLYVPKLYIKAGSIYEIKDIPFSYYPQLLDLLYMIPLYFHNDIIPKYIHFAFAAATSFLIYSYLKERFERQAGLAGALFFLTIPVIVKLSITVYVDLGLIFFTFASIIYLFKWKNSGLKWRYLINSGVFTGLAMGTKYNGIVTFILLTLLLPLLVSKNDSMDSADYKESDEKSNKPAQSKFKILLYPAVFAITAILIFSPWMIKNYVWTGEPLYPLYKMNIQSNKHVELPEHDIEESSNILEGDKNVIMSHFLIRKHVYHEKWWETLSIPVRIFFQGEDDNPALFDGRLNPFLFIIPTFFMFCYILGQIGEKSQTGQNTNKNTTIDSESIFLILFATVYLLLVFFKTDMRIRYISPIIPPLVIVYVAGLYKIKEFLQLKLVSLKNNTGSNQSFNQITFDEHKDSQWKIIAISSIVPLIFCITIYFNISYYKGLFLHINPVDYISGRVSKSDYISRFRPEYELIEHFNKNAPQDSKVLALFLGDRGYYFDNQVIFGRELLFHAVKTGINENDIVAALKKNGFTHLIIGFDLFNRSLQTNLTPEEQIKIKSFFENQILLIKHNSFYGLYLLR